MVGAPTHSFAIDNIPVFFFLLECPNGHPYYVGEVRIMNGCSRSYFSIILQCGQPVQQAVCITCGSSIGGVQHTTLASNRAARTYVSLYQFQNLHFILSFNTEVIVHKLATAWATPPPEAMSLLQSVTSHLLPAVL